MDHRMYQQRLSRRRRLLLGLHNREWAIIAPNGDVRFKYGCHHLHHQGPRCDRCGTSLLNPNGTVSAEFLPDRPGLAFVECPRCETRNTRPSRARIYG